MASDVQSQFDILTARVEAQEREIENLKTRGRGKQADARISDQPSSRRELLKLGGLAGAASVAAIAGISRPETAEATYTIVGGAENTADQNTDLNPGLGPSGTGFVGGYMLGLNMKTNGNGAFISGLISNGISGGAGVIGTGGSGNGTGAGVAGTGGGGNGTGVVGTGGGTNSYGVTGTGKGDHAGVVGIGGASGPGVLAKAGGPDGNGVTATGYGAGAGVSGTAAGAFGYGVSGVGGSNGTGVTGQGNGSGWGVSGYGGNNQGHGVVGYGGTAGLGGAFSGPRAQIQLIPASSPGTPSQQNSKGDIWVDSAGMVFVCIADGNPGTWVALQTAGSNVAASNSFYRAVITSQPTLLSSNGNTWVDIDPSFLLLSITPPLKCLAVLTGNCDLWTDTAGYNQDLGITVSGGVYPTTPLQPEAWKESGGPGIFSPNAAFVQTAVPLLAGTAYTIKLQWKTAKNAPGVTIWAGAGPIGGKFSPTSLTASLIPTP